MGNLIEIKFRKHICFVHQIGIKLKLFFDDESGISKMNNQNIKSECFWVCFSQIL